MKKILAAAALPYIRRELPGWGGVYRALVGGYDQNPFWADSLPRVIRDKRYGKLRLVDIREWADRSLYFLGRWYDLEAQVTLDGLLNPGDVVVDVGANYGHFSLSAAANVGETGRILSFEPNPVAYARFCTHIYLNKLPMIEAKNAGLSDTPGEMELSVPTINSGEASFAGTPYEDSIKVSCRVLVGDHELEDVDVSLIKIDVEGFEVRVLMGLDATITRCRPWIMTEIVRRHLARDERTPEDLADFFRAKDYVPLRLSLAGPKGRAKRLVLSEFDASKEEGDVLWAPAERRNELTFG